MRKGKLVGKIFGIALVFVLVGSMLGGLAGIANASAPEDSGSPTALSSSAYDPSGEIFTINKLAAPQVIQSDYTSTPPTIDGLLSPNEWGSPVITKTLNYVNCITNQNETHEILAYFMNDGAYLYIAIKITDDDFEAEEIQEGDIDVIELYFDNDTDGLIEPNEDIKNFWNLKYRDWFYNPTEERPIQWSEDERADGIGAASHSTHSEGDYIYEFKIPLDSGDIHDLAIAPGSTVGIKILYREMYYDPDSGHWKWDGTEDGWPTKEGRFDGVTYGKLALSSAPQKTWYVDDDLADYPNADFTKIQDAVNAASDGDTIIVYDGIYQEHVTLDKSLILKTNEGATIDGGGTLSTVTIATDGCTVSGFTITGSGSHSGENAGARIDSDYNTISGNTISGNKQDGVLLNGSYNTITNNLISENKGNGLYMGWARENTIESNTISGNEDYGIYLSGEDSILRDNVMGGNGRNFGINYRYYNDVDTSNTVDGKPIYYLFKEQDEVIDSDTDAGYVVAIDSGNITIKDLTLANNDSGVTLYDCQNCLVDNIIIQDNDNGIYLRSCSGITVQNCTISANERGLYLSYSDNTVFSLNAIEDNSTGIRLRDSDANLITDNTIRANEDGITLRDAYDNVIESNEVTDNDYTAIALDESDGNLITDNTIRGNRSGINLWESYDCRMEHNLVTQNERTGIEVDEGCGHLIYGNTISENADYGIRIYDAKDNDIHHNNFTHNAYNAFSEETNSWDDGSEGNYWSDYEERYPDAGEVDGTGIWDTPYEIPGEAGATDDYPLMEPYSPNQPSNPSPTNHATGVSIGADLSWTGGDPDAGDTVTYDVYFGTSASPPPVSNDQSATTYDPGTLSYNTKYYWKIVATDNHEASTSGPLWDFTTRPPGPTKTWNLRWGLDADPAAVNIWLYPADAVQVTLASVEWSMPSGLLIWHYGGPTDGWRFYKKGWGASNTLATLVPGEGYIGIVPAASVWEIPQG